MSLIDLVLIIGGLFLIFATVVKPDFFGSAAGCSSAATLWATATRRLCT